MDSIPILLSLVGATGLGITALVYTGLRGLRRAHFVVLGPTLAILAATIYSAESVGRLYDFAPTAFAVHMAFAWSATITILIALMGALITGPWMISTGVLKSPEHQPNQTIAPPVAVVFSLMVRPSGDRQKKHPDIRSFGSESFLINPIRQLAGAH